MKTIYSKPEISIIQIQESLLAGSVIEVANGGMGSNEDFADSREGRDWE